MTAFFRDQHFKDTHLRTLHSTLFRRILTSNVYTDPHNIFSASTRWHTSPQVFVALFSRPTAMAPDQRLQSWPCLPVDVSLFNCLEPSVDAHIRRLTVYFLCIPRFHLDTVSNSSYQLHFQSITYFWGSHLPHIYTTMHI